MSPVPEADNFATDAPTSSQSVCDAVFAVRSAPSVLNDAPDTRQDRQYNSNMPSTDHGATTYVDESGEQTVLFGFAGDENGRRRSGRIRAKGKNIDYSQLFSAERFGLVEGRHAGENGGAVYNGADPSGFHADDEYDEALFDDPHQRVFEELNLSDGEEEYKPELDDEAQTSEDELEEQAENDADVGSKSKRNSLYCTETDAGLIEPSSSSRFMSNTTYAARSARGAKTRGRGGGTTRSKATNNTEKRVKRTATYQPRRRDQPSLSLIKREQQEDNGAGGFVPCYGVWTPHTSAGGSSGTLITNPYAYYAMPGPLQQQQFASTSGESGQYSQFQPQYVSAGQLYSPYYAMPTAGPANGVVPRVPTSDPYGFAVSSGLATATKREIDEIPNENDPHDVLDEDDDDIGGGSSRAYAQTGPRKRRKRGGGAASGPGADRSEHNRKERIRRAFITKRVLDCWQYVVAAAEQHGGGRDFTRYAPKLDKIRLVSFITAFLDAMKEQMDDFYGQQVWLGMQKVANQRALSLGDIDGNIALLRELEAFDSETAKRMLKTMQLRAQQQPDTVQEAASNSTTILTTTERIK